LGIGVVVVPVGGHDGSVVVVLEDKVCQLMIYIGGTSSIVSVSQSALPVCCIPILAALMCLDAEIMCLESTLL
jgi:hypothetical protein